MKKQIAGILRWQAKRFIKKNKPKIVVVAGSVGKTSTTQAIATVLKSELRIRVTLKNYNSDIGVPCSIFQKNIPSQLRNPLSWLVLFVGNESQLLRKTNLDALVLELGTDVPGEIPAFSWLQPDVAVVTAVADEHMEAFKTIENVALEELSVASYSDTTLINKSMVAKQFLQYADTEELFTYDRSDLERLEISADDLQVNGNHSLDAIAAGVAVGKLFELQNSSLVIGAKNVQPVAGRMNSFAGISNTTIIDDTYNASPEAVIAALDYLYSVDTPQRIALLGNMNELGDTSKDSHERVGAYCDPDKLDLVVTLGPDANKYTATIAKDKGCAVAEAHTPYKAAEIIKRQLRDGAVVLCKGSQNGVFAEEAVKALLANSEDSKKLVRQSDFWLKKKQQNFANVEAQS